MPYVETIGVLCSGASEVKNLEHIEPWGISENLVAHYTFDGNANDASGNGNNGVLHDVTTTADRHGNVGGAYHFNGTSSYVEVPDSDSLREVGQTVTISTWVKPDVICDNWISIVCKGANNRQYGMQINTQTGIWQLNKSADAENNVSVSTNLCRGEWSHVVLTYAPTLISAYLNGELIGTMSPNGNIIENSTPLYIGMDPPGAAEYLTGDMDEVRIYNRALSASEVRALYNSDNPVACSIDDGTWLYRYDVDEGVGVVWSGFGDVPSVLNIPESIDGKQVVQIGSYAFYGCTNLESVVLSNCISNLTVGGHAFNASTMVTIADRDGYEFMGWRNGAGRMVADPFHSGKTVSVTPVWRKVETAVIDGYTWTYAVIDGEATIGIGSTAVNPAPDGDVVIPAEIGGYPVTGIASNAFKDCVGMTSLTISSNVTSVGIGTFDGCSGLTNLIIESESLSCIVPGLMQAKFDTRFDTMSSLYTASDVAHVSGVIAAYQKVTTTPWEFSDPQTGNVYAWNEANTTFAYFGQMYLEAGKTYVFGTHIDDDAYVKIEEEILVSVQYPESDSKVITGSFACDKSGWYDVEFRLSDGGGSKGSWAKIWSADFGIGYRDDGGTGTPQYEWNRLLDAGDGSLFRCQGMHMLFDGCSNLVSVTMPWSLVTTMAATFPDAYDKLETVTLTGDPEMISNGAFAGCTSLAHVMLPQSVGTLTVGMNAFDAVTSIEIEDRDGYAFCGWTNATGNVVADPFHSGTANTVSPWWKKTVTVAFDANGGTGTMAEQMGLEGDNLTLAENRFGRAGYLFLGWAELENGTVEFADGETISGIEAAADGTILYAVWKPCAPNLIPSENATFPNASQAVSISCAAADATILYTTDGSDPSMNGNEYRGPFSVYESCTVRAIARGAGHDSDEVSITLTRAEGLSEAANLYGYLMETDGTYPWTVVSDISHDGVSCVRSGNIGNGGMTWLQTSLKKAGTVSFWWRAACEEPDPEDGEDGYYDYGAFLVDGNVAARLAGNDTGWQFFSTNITSGGKHVLRWEYRKDGATTYAPDCLWLDQVQWIPADGSGYTLTTPEPVPYAWLSGYGLGLDSDFETAAKGATGKRGGDGKLLSVWQDYVAGTDPTNAASMFTAEIEFVDGVPQVTWSPNLNTNGVVRSYTIWGKENLTDAAWHSPTNAADRFFKVLVEIP